MLLREDQTLLPRCVPFINHGRTHPRSLPLVGNQIHPVRLPPAVRLPTLALLLTCDYHLCNDQVLSLPPRLQLCLALTLLAEVCR